MSAAAAAGRRGKPWWSGSLTPLITKQHNPKYLYLTYGHKNPIISRLYFKGQEHKDDDEKMQLTAQHVYLHDRYFENTVTKPPHDIFPGWNIPPTFSGRYYITNMIEFAKEYNTLSEEEINHIYTSMLAPCAQHQQQCNI